MFGATLAACVPRPAETPGAGVSTTATPVQASIPRGARRYDIDSSGSLLTVLVRRAGPLARLGHNHAITTTRVQGIAWLGRTPETSGFELHVPVASFVVDDPAARAAAGPDFPGTVPEEARAGTQHNMLRTEVLDAAQYPEVVVRCDHASGGRERLMARVSITLRGATHAYDVPVILRTDGNRLLAQGRLTLQQTDFGITPFSVAGGAIQVADAVEVRFAVAARALATVEAR